MKTIFINNKKIKEQPKEFYLVTNNSIDQLDELFGFQAEPYAFNTDLGCERGTILEYESTDEILKKLFPTEYYEMSRKMTTEQLRNIVK